MKKGFLKLSIFFAFAFMFLPVHAFATEIQVEKSVDSAKPGNEFTVYVKASKVESDSISGYSIYLTYDTSKIEFRSYSSDISDVDARSNPIIIEIIETISKTL